MDTHSKTRSSAFPRHSGRPRRTRGRSATAAAVLLLLCQHLGVHALVVGSTKVATRAATFSRSDGAGVRSSASTSGRRPRGEGAGVGRGRGRGRGGVEMRSTLTPPPPTTSTRQQTMDGGTQTVREMGAQMSQVRASCVRAGDLGSINVVMVLLLPLLPLLLLLLLLLKVSERARPVATLSLMPRYSIPSALGYVPVWFMSHSVYVHARVRVLSLLFFLQKRHFKFYLRNDGMRECPHMLACLTCSTLYSLPVLCKTKFTRTAYIPVQQYGI